MQVDSAAPYVVRITNDLYQPVQSTGTRTPNLTMQWMSGKGGSDAAAASAAAAAAADDDDVWPSAKAGVSNKVSSQSTTSLVGLHQVCGSYNI